MADTILGCIIGWAIGIPLIVLFLSIKSPIENKRKKKKDINCREYAFRRVLGYTKAEMEGIGVWLEDEEIESE